MNKLLGYAVVAAVAGAAGYIAGKGMIKGLPDQFSINIPYGPKFSYKKAAPAKA